MLEMALGLRYGGVIGRCDNGAKLTFNIAWDCQYWPNHMYQMDAFIGPFDYQMQGLTFGAKLAY